MAYPKYDIVISLACVVEKELYEAKRGCRDQVVVS